MRFDRTEDGSMHFTSDIITASAIEIVKDGTAGDSHDVASQSNHLGADVFAMTASPGLRSNARTFRSGNTMNVLYLMEHGRDEDTLVSFPSYFWVSLGT